MPVYHRKPLPLDRAIKWSPAHDGYYLVAGTLATSRDAVLLCAGQPALIQVEAHVRQAGETDCYGLLLGDLYNDPDRSIRYVLVEQAVPAPSAANGDPAARGATLHALIAAATQRGKVPVGWYRAGAQVVPHPSPADSGLHLELFPEPWPVMLCLDHTGSGRAGAFTRVQPSDMRPYAVPFLELLSKERVDGRMLPHTAVLWSNYRSSPNAVALPDEAFTARGDRGSGALGALSQASSAWLRRLGGGSAGEATDRQPPPASAQAPGDTRLAARAPTRAAGPETVVERPAAPAERRTLAPPPSPARPGGQDAAATARISRPPATPPLGNREPPGTEAPRRPATMPPAAPAARPGSPAAPPPAPPRSSIASDASGTSTRPDSQRPAPARAVTTDRSATTDHSPTSPPASPAVPAPPRPATGPAQSQPAADLPRHAHPEPNIWRDAPRSPTVGGTGDAGAPSRPPAADATARPGPRLVEGDEPQWPADFRGAPARVATPFHATAAPPVDAATSDWFVFLVPPREEEIARQRATRRLVLRTLSVVALAVAAAAVWYVRAQRQSDTQAPGAAQSSDTLVAATPTPPVRESKGSVAGTPAAPAPERSGTRRRSARNARTPAASPAPIESPRMQEYGDSLAAAIARFERAAASDIDQAKHVIACARMREAYVTARESARALAAERARTSGTPAPVADRRLRESRDRIRSMEEWLSASCMKD